MRNDRFQFRCIGNPSVIYKPAWMYDVAAMRLHTEYEEVDAEGNVVPRHNEDLGYAPVPLKTAPLKTAPLSLPKKGKK